MSHTEVRGTKAREILAAEALRCWKRAKAAGNSDHPLAQRMLRESQTPSFNLVTWSPETGVVFDWYVDVVDGQ